MVARASRVRSARCARTACAVADRSADARIPARRATPRRRASGVSPGAEQQIALGALDEHAAQLELAHRPRQFARTGIARERVDGCKTVELAGILGGSSAIWSLMRCCAPAGTLPSASSMKAVGVLITRAARPALSTEASRALGLCRLPVDLLPGRPRRGRHAGQVGERPGRTHIVIMKVDDLDRGGTGRVGERAGGGGASAQCPEEWAPRGFPS